MSDAGQSPEVTAEARELHERGVEALREGRALDAEDLFREAYEAGHAGAAKDLGDSLAVWRDRDGAREWWRRAADAGITGAAYSLGLHADEEGDPEEAERWYRRAAADEHRDALLNLGKLLEGRDEDESMRLYLRAGAGVRQGRFQHRPAVRQQGSADGGRALVPPGGGARQPVRRVQPGACTAGSRE
ncbi:tetratricopeptide repeat protein [Streptomyces sp. NPDC087525]|uniref:tetratricopeptide repeat protein n=1 Tax=Streptomyces sp. NPDC087525 TaxID=3365793 RepID=UPI0037FDA9F0